MAKDYVIVGRLELDVGRWSGLPAALDVESSAKNRAAKRTAENWPALLGPIEAGPARGTVADALARLAMARSGPAFFEIRAESGAVTLEGVLGEDDLREHGQDLACVLAAAQGMGARGRVQLRDAGTGTGAAISLEGGARRLETFTPRSTPSAEDLAAFRRVLGAPTSPPKPAKGARPDRWSLEVAGLLTLATKDWLGAPARTGTHAWPKVLGAVPASAQYGTVAEAIAALVHDDAASFLEVRVAARSVSLAGSVREGALLDRAGALVALLTAAAERGASGVLYVRGPGGIRVELEEGALKVKALDPQKRLAPKDAVLFERLGELVRQRAGVALDPSAKARIAARERARARRARTPSKK